MAQSNIPSYGDDKQNDNWSINVPPPVSRFENDHRFGNDHLFYEIDGHVDNTRGPVNNAGSPVNNTGGPVNYATPRKTRTAVVGSHKPAGLHWSADIELEDRVLMIDYLRDANEYQKLNTREFYDLATLESVYNDKRDTNAFLRVFHVQNSTWATKFLIRKFRIKSDDDNTGHQEFYQWLEQDMPERRAGKPFLVGKSWKTIADPWRGVKKCSFGLDYMKRYPVSETQMEGKESCVSGLLGYGDNGNLVKKYNVYSQRLSVYVQYAVSDLRVPESNDESPYRDPESGDMPPRWYDNGSTIIIFDNPGTCSIHDSLISARGGWESGWRRLPSYLTSSSHGENKQMPLDCMKVITQDIFKALATCWEQILDASSEHVSMLGEGIYGQPADDSQAPELWSGLAHWHYYEKLMFYHMNIVKKMRIYLVEMEGDQSGEGLWLNQSPEDFQPLSDLIQDDLIKKTNYLLELMYKSVAIRDSRLSLQLGTSMWRLSWITFIFLPLTFMVGFFGMNVDTFTGSPSIKWYFVTTVPFMAVVFISWYLQKSFTRQRHFPSQRGTYEALYKDLHNCRPDLWSLAGPLDCIQPKDRVSKIKWSLIVHWMSPERLPPPRLSVGQAPGNQPLGTYNRLKQHFVKRWTSEIKVIDGLPPHAEVGP